MGTIIRIIIIAYIYFSIKMPLSFSVEGTYEILNFEKKINLFPSCELSISHFGAFHVPSSIQRPYQLTKYVPVVHGYNG